MNAGRGVPVISFVGKSGVGKTTALELVIAEIKERGLRMRLSGIEHLNEMGGPVSESIE